MSDNVQNSPTNTSEIPSPTAVAAEFDSAMFPSVHRPLWQFLLDHNPCLLLSTVCMLLGCYLINSALHAGNEGDSGKLFGLLGVINLYEACIIPLGLLLVRRFKTIARDGLWLILFETLFLVNATFINVDPSVVGWWLNGVLLLLALVKVGIILTALGIDLISRTYLFIALQLALTYALPVFLRMMNVDGVVDPRLMLALWWLIALLPWAYDLLDRLNTHVEEQDLVRAIVRRAYLIIPWVLLTAHLGFAHWAHHSDWQPADLSPVLIGLAVATLRIKAGEGVQFASGLRFVRVVLPVLALLLSLSAGRDLQGQLFGSRVEPFQVTLVAVIVFYAYCVSPLTALWALGSVITGVTAYFCRQGLWSLGRSIGNLGHSTLESTLSFIPATATSWGLVAIISAFVLLALGGAIALRKVHSP